MRILYAGSPDCAAEVLRELSRLLEGTGNEISAVLTNPPSTKGRHHDLIPTPTGLVAEELGIPVITPEKLNAEAREQVSAYAPDLLVCFAYGRIFGPKFMALFPKGGINYHPSLLPLYRGCAPVPAAIWNREAETGFTVQKVAQEMDSGDILMQQKYTMNGTETADSLLHTAAEAGAPMLKDVILRIQAGTAEGIPQDSSKATYCSMMSKEDGEINWNDSATAIDAVIRACTPWPGAWTTVNGTVLKILEASIYKGQQTFDCSPGTAAGTDKAQGILFQTGDGILAVKTLQWQAKKAMPFKDFLNGSRNFPGSVCSSRNMDRKNEEKPE